MKRSIHSMFVLATLSLVLLGCSTSSDTTKQNPFALTEYTPTGRSPQPCVSFSSDAPVQMTQGAKLDVTLIAQNICKEDVRLPLGSNVPQDLLVIDKNDVVLWQFSSVSDPRQAIIEFETLSPDEKLTFQVTWSGTDNGGRVVPVGDYRLVGLLYSSDESNREVYTGENQNFETVQSLTIQP